MEIKEALQKLDPKNDDHWTSDGLPLVSVMTELTGNDVLTRQQITDANPEFNRSIVLGTATTSPEEKPPSGLEGPNMEGKSDAEGSEEKDEKEKTENQEEITKNSLDQEIVVLSRERDILNREIHKLQVLRDRLQELEFGETTAKADTVARLGYIKMQNLVRARKSVSHKAIVKALGVNNIDPRAKIDAAMAHKRGRGTQRPVRPTHTT